jgi:hypothetical protein
MICVDAMPVLLTYLNVPVWPSRRNEGDGVIGAQRQAHAREQALTLSHGGLQLKDTFDCRLLAVESVQEYINVTCACYRPVKIPN